MLYKDSGVDIDRGDNLVDFLKSVIKLSRENIGPFSAAIDLSSLKGFKNPVLLASTDGIGTKIDLALKWNKLEGLGYDLFGMCVNDIAVYGAKPLFFLDYYATGHLDLEVAKVVLSSLVKACEEFECPLVGGETAELPDLIQQGKFDIAGFVVGVQDKEKIPSPQKVEIGDVLVGLSSSGIHSNGYSLVRKIVEKAGIKEEDPVGKGTAKEVLLKPTRIYTKIASEAFNRFHIHGAAHITGGGIPGNLSRCLPKNLDAKISKNSWKIHEVFEFLKIKGEVPDEEMWRVFNMGIGFIFIVAQKDLRDFLKFLEEIGEEHFVIGSIVPGSGKVIIE